MECEVPGHCDDGMGRVLWRHGNKAVMRKADGICLEEGAAWSESKTGMNGIGTALATRGPVRVHSAEHFIRALHAWTCAAAPVRDPRDGRLLGIVDISGPASTFHPTTPALVGSVAGPWWWIPGAGSPRCPGCRRWTGCRCPSPCGRDGCG